MTSNTAGFMRAISIEQYGGPEVLRLRDDAAIPLPGPGEIQVKVAFAGINFMDIHTRQGKYRDSRTYPVRLPCTLGMEGSGVVTALGQGVSHLSVGDRVAWCIAWGSYAQYCCIEAFRAARIPDALGLDQAAAAIFQACTAHYLIDEVGKIGPGSSCLVHAASGSIGQLLIQMAKARGALVCATASSEKKRAVALSLGADFVFPYEQGGFAERTRAATQGLGVDVVFDSVGLATLRHGLGAARTRGLIVNYGNVSGSLKDLDPMELGEAGSLYLTRPRLADHMRNAQEVQRRADEVFAAILDGSLRMGLAGVYTLEEVPQVHARIEQREQIGKAIVRL